MRLTFLGTGTSFGVPQIGCGCAVCHSSDPRDRRTRAGALLREEVDAVLYTHAHADHVNGIDDLRMFSVRRRRPLPLYGPPETLERLRTSFDYIFNDTVHPYEGTSKPCLELHPLEPNQPVSVAGLEVLPLAFRHGHLRVYGYRVGALAYITDVKSVPAEERRLLRGLQVLVLNALWWRPHPTHLSIGEAIETAQDLAAERTYLTHLTHETGHAELEGQLPPGILPAYDGLTVEVA
jgi:phosphoribosyl 1,2-cyclic phosphate phosphodiesterase